MLTKSKVFSSLTAFTLIELLFSVTISIIVITALAGFVVHNIKIYHQQQTHRELLDQATLISQMWQTQMNQVEDTGCAKSTQALTFINLSGMDLPIFQGIKIYQVGKNILPTFFPKADIKKLLPQSLIIVQVGPVGAFANAVYIPQDNKIQTNALNITPGDLFFLSDCKHAYLITTRQVRKEGEHKKISFMLPTEEKNTHFILASWQMTFWYVMHDQNGEYGLYRINFPHETTPVEMINHIQNITVLVHQTDGVWSALSAVIDWATVDALRFDLVLEKKHLQLHWPISVVLHLSKINGVRQL